MSVSRRRATREKALQALYAYELSKEPITTVMENVLSELRTYREDFEFAKKLITEAIRHQEDIEVYIRRKVAHWEFDRIAVIDRLILRMGICELLYFPDIPPKVSINEAIEVAKTFSTERSGQFINGVLDAILSELKNSKTLNKAGRGLIDETPSKSSPASARQSPRSR